MAILNKKFLNLIKLRLIALAIICENGVVTNEQLIELLKISASHLRTKYTEPLQREGLIHCVKIHSEKAWGAKPMGHVFYNEIIILLNHPKKYLENLDLSPETDFKESRDTISEST